MNRIETLDFIKRYYSPQRVEAVDKDFLDYEEEMISDKDLNKIAELLFDASENEVMEIIPNIYNSIILYVTGLSNDFNFKLGRSYMTGGSPADIDTDVPKRSKEKLIEWIVNKWGRENVAHIAAYGTFGMAEMVNDYYRIQEPLEVKKTDYEEEADYDAALIEYKKRKDALNKEWNTLSDLIPEAKHGIAPSYDRTIKENLERVKDKKPDPIDLEKEYPGFCNFAKYAYGIRKKATVHAAGLVLSNEPISNYIPIYKNKDYDFITQFDKDEVEQLGLLKQDLLVIDILDVMEECLQLINKDNKNPLDLVKDIYNKDGDEKTYKMMEDGLLIGVFQMETSDSAKGLIQSIKPKSIEDLGDINALNRPGPMEAGLLKIYIDNKNSGKEPEDMPECLKVILKETYYAICYQEQIMKICSVLANFSLKEADDIRRAMGKKDAKKMAKYKEIFITRSMNNQIASQEYIEKLWEDMAGFAEYCFNKSHSISYSFITYATAYLKANYPLQFFTAYLTIKSQEKQPQVFQEKLKGVYSECKQMGIELRPPDIHNSDLDFTYKDNTIYFGLAGIKGLAKGGSKLIMEARKKGPFKDIMDFTSRIDRGKLNLGKFEALVKSGCFDKMGYNRKDLIDNKNLIYNYYSDLEAYEQRIIDKEIRDQEREEAIKTGGKKKVALKLFEKPIMPEIPRHSKIVLSMTDIQEQAEYLGCYLGVHPTDAIKGDYLDIANLWIGETKTIRGLVTYIKEIKTKKGDMMAFIKLEDGSGICEGTVFTQVWKKNKELIKLNSIIKATVKIKSEKPIKVIINSVEGI